MPHFKKICFFSALLLAGCAAPVVVEPVKTDATFSAMDRSLIALPTLKLIGPETTVAAPIYGALTSVSYLGDAATLLESAAKGRGDGWRFEVSGPQPHLPIYVQISVKQVLFNDFLKNVAEQLGQRADIELGDKVIRLRHRAQG